MPQLRVLVVGASIAGPMTAYWLARAGANVTVIERFPSLRTNGQNIDIRTCGVTVMSRTPGMEAAVRAKVSPLEGMSMVRDDGRPYGTIRQTGNPEQQSLVSEYEIFRGDLAKILVDLTKDNKNVRYTFGEQVASMQQHEKDDGPLTVEFASGTPTAEYDLVVACDGATSRTRAMGLGCGLRDHVYPTNCWAAYFSIKNDILQGGNIGIGLTSPGGRFMAVGPDPASSGTENRATFMSINPRTDLEAVPQFRAAQSGGDAALKRFVGEKFRDVGWKSQEIVDGMLESDDLYANEVVQVKPPTLSKGRFTMVGDAGYAPGFTGGGTSLALTGAYVLAGEVLRHPGDIAAGLKGYEERMRPIITDLQKVPPGVPGILAPQSAWGCWVRNWIFAFITWSGVLEWGGKFFSNAFAGDTYGLPEYEWVA